MVSQELKQSPPNPKNPPLKEPDAAGNGDKIESMLSPRFKSAAAMAGWDEEALLIASLVVEDTPDRDSKQKRRPDLQFKTPPTTKSRRKRRAQKRSPISVSVPVLDLDAYETSREETDNMKKTESKTNADEEREVGKRESTAHEIGVSSSSSNLPCMDRLREELSCAICLEICFEPSTTSCGHSFCKKCLRSAADKCGKRCPKCRQIISNGRSCTVNTVLWNTIQLLFPQEVEARKAAGALNNKESKRQPPPKENHCNERNRSIQALNSPEAERQIIGRGSYREVRNRNVEPSGTSSRGDVSERRRRRWVPSQDEDAALALRLQREEFMEAFRGSESDEQQYRSSLSLARANLRRAMASRAISIRTGGRPPT